MPFENFRQALREKGPDEQVIFIDACRAPVPNETGLYGTTALLFDRRDESEYSRKQALLYGTTNGTKAKQIVRGFFSEALIKGLKGQAELEDVLLEPDVYALSFPKLVRYVISQVQKMAKNVGVTQVPEPLRTPDLELAKFEGKPKATLTLTVLPPSALAVATVRVQWRGRPSR